MKKHSFFLGRPRLSLLFWFALSTSICHIISASTPGQTNVHRSQVQLRAGSVFSLPRVPFMNRWLKRKQQQLHISLSPGQLGEKEKKVEKPGILAEEGDPECMAKTARSGNDATDTAFNETRGPILPMSSLVAFFSRQLHQLNPIKLVRYGVLFYLGYSVYQELRVFLRSDGSFWESVTNDLGLPNIKKRNLSSPALQHLAALLQRSGLPMYQNQTKSASVESILQSLSPTEIQLLESCLWVPTKSEATTQAPDFDWEGTVLGLHSVKQRLRPILRDIVIPAYCRHSSSAGYVKRNNPFAPLFTNDPSGLEEETLNSTGILLYGPPGCGKSLLLNSLAKAADIHSNTPTLHLTPTVFYDKYIGVTNQRIRSLFQLVAKLTSGGSSTVLLILDELDGLLRERSSKNEDDFRREFKTEFLQYWDRLGNIVVLGATNRPFDVDSAVLRRLPIQCPLNLPTPPERLELLQAWLAQVPCCEGIDLQRVVLETDGYSTSDLKQLLQAAARVVMDNGGGGLCTGHVLHSIEAVRPTAMSPQYRHQLKQFGMTAPTQQQGQDEMTFVDAGTMEMKWNTNDDSDNSGGDDDNDEDDDISLTPDEL